MVGVLSNAVERLAVESCGVGEPLVLLHGWALHAGLFRTISPCLARANRVHAVDLPGHGHSAPLPRASMHAIVEMLEGRFATVDRPLSVLGWSFGGAVALAWAHAHPDRIAKLVLVTTTPRFVAGPDWRHASSKATLARFADELRVGYRATLLRFLTLQVQASEAERSTLVALRARLFERGEPDSGALIDTLRMLMEIDLRPIVPTIRQPVLVVTGTRDTLAPAAAGAWLAANLPNGTLHEITNAAHAPFLSHADIFLHRVLPFLADG
ncbi:MAG TPA: alpha/beta fold hydrolase [Casimicrobiaceae bacterium]|nr:alpha/beta fold hydrolase [Casimicrobiaceae bacterium]